MLMEMSTCKRLGEDVHELLAGAFFNAHRGTKSPPEFFTYIYMDRPKMALERDLHGESQRERGNIRGL
jgi:hypothetical protein